MGVVFTERELDIMAVLWAEGPSTASEVRAALADDITHNTVQKMLSILEAKGHVAHVEEGRMHRFHALVAREEAGTSAFSRLIEKMFAGSAEALLLHFVRDERLTRGELERARRALEDRLNDAPLLDTKPTSDTRPRRRPGMAPLPKRR